MPIVLESLSAGSVVRLTATGSSMVPFIRNGDTVDIAPVGASAVRVGDVVLARLPTGSFVLHRVVALSGTTVELAGDHGRRDGLVPKDCVYGRATTVIRCGRQYRIDTGVVRALGLCWIRTRSVGPALLQAALAARRVLRARSNDQQCAGKLR